MKKIAILGIFISIIACNQKNTTENTIEETITKNEETINAALKKMYYDDINSKYPLADTLLFSKEIIELNKQCDALTKADADRIAKSDTPTERPIMREGSSISTVFEGVTDFKVNEIKEVNNKTEVSVTLSNKNYSEIKPWNEKIIFINQNGLKIDNIYFVKEKLDTNEPNLKNSLLNFIKQFEEQTNEK